MELRGADWIQWAQLPQTKEFCKFLDFCVKEHQEDWLHRAYESDSQHEWIEKNAAALGSAGALSTLKQTIENLAQGEAHAGTEPIRPEGQG